MSIYASVSCSTSEIFAFSKSYMDTVRIFVAFCQAKVNNEYTVSSLLVTPNQKIIRFNIPVDYSLLMQLLYSLYL